MSVIKNPTPQQISFFSAAIISLVVAVVAIIIYFMVGLSERAWYGGILLVLFCFAASYLTIIYYLRQYIYRKIKLIYKSIHKHKLDPAEKTTTIDARSDIISEVEREVAEWADTQAEEIKQLKSWQEYRRRFLGDISHELKTPIFNIQGYLETLIDGGMDDPTINRNYLERAVKNVDRLNTIVTDLESISRLETGDLVLEMQNFDIRELVEEVFEDFEFKAQAKGITLGFKSGADQRFRVCADRESIRQVITNLITNSIKYGRDEGVTKVGFYDMDRYILVEVADNGIGIEKDHIKHIFERFYRVDKSRSRAQGGSGLGLSIVKHLIEAHKQTVNVRSSVNLGSTFGFTLEKA